ncbi:MAG: Bcr/CflA family efflux MFS transporter [Burkholderiaceae bacterium]
MSAAGEAAAATGSHPQTSPPPSGKVVVANIIAQITFGLLAMTICLPSIQEWGQIFGADQASVQLTFSGYVITYGAIQLLFGPLSDRFGRKRMLMVGLVVGGLASILAALATSLPALIVARVLQGAGGAASSSVGRAMIQDLFKGPERTRVMAYVGMTMGLMPPAATILGGQIHEAIGWQGNFVVMAVLAVVLLITGSFGLPMDRARPPSERHWLREMASGYALLARERRFPMYVIILASSVATFYTFLSGAPLVLKSYGVGPAGVGFYIMVVPLSYVVGNFGTTRLISRVGENWLMNVGQAVTITGIALMTALGFAGLHSPLAFALPLMLLGIGHGFFVPVCLARTVGLVPAVAGTAAAVTGLVQQWTGAVGGYAVGLVTHENSVNLGLLMLGFAAIAIVAQALVMARLKRGAA